MAPFYYMNAIKFYIMPDSASSGSDEMLRAVCQIIARYYHAGEWVFVLAENQQQAEQLDELLWQFEADEFVAHNLVGEGPAGGAPVEIGWQESSARRAILVNLAATVAQQASRYAQVIDFVPADEAGKQQARERYKVYRGFGLTPQTEPFQS